MSCKSRTKNFCDKNRGRIQCCRIDCKYTEIDSERSIHERSTDTGVIVIHNARVITMNELQPKANYVIIRGNKIEKVGRGKPPKVGCGAKIIDAQRKVLIPGIQDQHLHWMRQAKNPGYELNDGESSFTKADLLKALKSIVKIVPFGEWISLVGRHNHKQFLANPDDPNSGEYPTIEELDAVASNHKVVFLQRFQPTVDKTGPIEDRFNNPIFSGSGQMNTLARDFFNNTPRPTVPPIENLGTIYKGSSENNFIGPEAMQLIPTNGRIPDWDETTDNFSNPFGRGQTGNQVYNWFRSNSKIGDEISAINRLVKWSHSVGLVGASDAGGFAFNQVTDMDSLMEAERRGILKVRIRYQMSVRNAPGCTGTQPNDRLAPLRNIIGAMPNLDQKTAEGKCPPPQEIQASGFHLSRVGSPFFKNNGIGEGVVPPGSTDGFPGSDQEHAIRMLLRRPDWKFSGHAEADQIKKSIIDLTNANSDPCALGSVGSRHFSIEHLNCATKEDFENMAKIGVGAGIQAVRFMFPKWQFMGPPYRLALDTPGLNVGFGADGMHAGHGNPWITMQFQVTGKTFNDIDILSDHPAGPQQITLIEALRGHTKGSAWFTREENERGQIKNNYLADIVILNQNPFKVCFCQIRKTKSILTIVDGKIVYNSQCK